MKSIATMIATFDSWKIDQMRDRLAELSLKGWEVKCCWTDFQDGPRGTRIEKHQHFLLQKVLEIPETELDKVNKRDKGSFETGRDGR